MEIRERKRSEGVPKETLENNCIDALAYALKEKFPLIDKDKLLEMAIENKYFDAPMTAQMDILAEVVFKAVGEKSDTVLEALIDSDIEKVNAIAVSAIASLYENDMDTQLRWFKKTAAVERTWPRESSCSALHRLFIKEGVADVLEKIYPWLSESNEGVRRVVTEGIRPRLMMVPHIEALKTDPSILKKVFEPLLEDPSEYVRKSVGNCMNDISKDNSEILLDWLEEWSQKPLSKERKQIFKRALRTLIVKGEHRAYKILGIPINSNVIIKIAKGFPEKVVLNQVINLEIEVINYEEEKLKAVFDLIMKAPGKKGNSREYIFKISVMELKPGEKKVIKKTLHFTDKTTQQKESGEYRVFYRKNTEVFQEEVFEFHR